MWIYKQKWAEENCTEWLRYNLNVTEISTSSRIYVRARKVNRSWTSAKTLSNVGRSPANDSPRLLTCSPRTSTLRISTNSQRTSRLFSWISFGLNVSYKYVHLQDEAHNLTGKSKQAKRRGDRSWQYKWKVINGLTKRYTLVVSRTKWTRQCYLMQRVWNFKKRFNVQNL